MPTAQGLESRESDTIETPAPTVWPVVAALGVTLMGGGLVTHVIVTAVGLLLGLIAAVGWWKDVLPQGRVEYVPLPPPGERATPVLPSPATVEYLTIGEAGHRVRVPVEVQPYSAGITGGLVGGVAMAGAGVPKDLGDFYCFADLSDQGISYESACRQFDTLGFVSNTYDKVGSPSGSPEIFQWAVIYTADARGMVMVLASIVASVALGYLIRRAQ